MPVSLIIKNEVYVGIEKEGNLIRNEQELVELFIEHYTNIAEKSSSNKPLSLGNF